MHDNIYGKMHIYYKCRENHNNSEYQIRPVVICICVWRVISDKDGDRKDTYGFHYIK